MNRVWYRLDDVAYNDAWESFAMDTERNRLRARQQFYIHAQHTTDNTFLFDRQVGEAFERTVQ